MRRAGFVQRPYRVCELICDPDDYVRLTQMLLDVSIKTHGVDPLHLHDGVPTATRTNAMRQVLESDFPWVLDRLKVLVNCVVALPQVSKVMEEALDRVAPRAVTRQREDRGEVS